MNSGLQRLMEKKKQQTGALGGLQRYSDFGSMARDLMTPESEDLKLTPESVEAPVNYEESVEAPVNYEEAVALQENAPLYQGGRAEKNESPEFGDGFDIGFGHKLTPDEEKTQTVYGIDISNGISQSEAYQILMKDVAIHRARVADKVGKEKFSKLPEDAQNALVDLSFTGVFDQFPKFTKALLSRDKEGVFKEYERYWTDPEGNRKKMDRRNDFMLSMLKSLDEKGYFNG